MSSRFIARNCILHRERKKRCALAFCLNLKAADEGIFVDLMTDADLKNCTERYGLRMDERSPLWEKLEESRRFYEENPEYRWRFIPATGWEPKKCIQYHTMAPKPDLEGVYIDMGDGEGIPYRDLDDLLERTIFQSGRMDSDDPRLIQSHHYLREWEARLGSLADKLDPKNPNLQQNVKELRRGHGGIPDSGILRDTDFAVHYQVLGWEKEKILKDLGTKYPKRNKATEAPMELTLDAVDKAIKRIQNILEYENRRGRGRPKGH